jgi:hypothetical protein
MPDEEERSSQSSPYIQEVSFLVELGMLERVRSFQLLRYGIMKQPENSPLLQASGNSYFHSEGMDTLQSLQ